MSTQANLKRKKNQNSCYNFIILTNNNYVRESTDIHSKATLIRKKFVEICEISKHLPLTSSLLNYLFYCLLMIYKGRNTYNLLIN
jgi:hypothetical protein